MARDVVDWVHRRRSERAMRRTARVRGGRAVSWARGGGAAGRCEEPGARSWCTNRGGRGVRAKRQPAGDDDGSARRCRYLRASLSTAFVPRDSILKHSQKQQRVGDLHGREAHCPRCSSRGTLRRRRCSLRTTNSPARAAHSVNAVIPAPAANTNLTCGSPSPRSVPARPRPSIHNPRSPTAATTPAH